MLDEAVATLTGLRPVDGVFVLRIARGREAGLMVADAGDAERRILTVMNLFDRQSAKTSPARKCRVRLSGLKGSRRRPAGGAPGHGNGPRARR